MTALRLLTFLALACAPSLTAQSSPFVVRNGVDVLVAADFAPLRGAKVGLITNQTGRTCDGKSDVDAFLATKACQLVALFSPEHGFAGALDQSKIADAQHSSGLVIHSLYGDVRKPTAEMLEGVDTLVFDIQDVGCRFYTYVATMRLAMEAAAEHGLRFVVLDRPNPIGGVAVDGPVLAAGDESFTAPHTIPVRHGMTAGELAKMMNQERGIDCKLDVIEMQGWHRDMLWDATGLVWVNPSPNMRSLNEALLYPGIGLIEYTNVSVGRGTDTPFELVGAPWIDGPRLAERLRAMKTPGVVWIPIEFTPSSSRFAKQKCSGVEIQIVDRSALDPLRAGLALATALHAQHPDEWRIARYTKLLDSPKVFAALEAGAGPDALCASWHDELQAFLERRTKFLIYDGVGGR